MSKIINRNIHCKEFNVAFVASSLPIVLLDSMIKSVHIKRIWVGSSSLLPTYHHLVLRHPEVELKLVSPFLLFHIFQVACFQIRAKFLGQTLFFFHECCCPVFDILLLLFRPNSSYLPRVTMNAFKRISIREYDNFKVKLFFRLFRLSNNFAFYQGFGEGNKTFSCLSLISYPSNVTSISLNESLKCYPSKLAPLSFNNKKILFLTGSDSVNSLILFKKLAFLANIAQVKGFTCYQKDHPRPSERLNCSIKNSINIDPSIPVEFLVDQFILAIGVGSTGLICFGKNAVSIIDCIGMPAKNHKFRKNHLLSLPSSSNIRFLNNLDDFGLLLDSL